MSDLPLRPQPVNATRYLNWKDGVLRRSIETITRKRTFS